MKPPAQEPAVCRWFPYACSRAIRVVIECTLASEHRALNHDLQERRMMLTAHCSLQGGAQGSSPELLSVDREINVLIYSVYSRNISFGALLIGVNHPAIVREIPHFDVFPAFPHFSQNVPHFWLYFEKQIFLQIVIIFGARKKFCG